MGTSLPVQISIFTFNRTFVPLPSAVRPGSPVPAAALETSRRISQQASAATKWHLQMYISTVSEILIARGRIIESS